MDNGSLSIFQSFYLPGGSGDPSRGPVEKWYSVAHEVVHVRLQGLQKDIFKGGLHLDEGPVDQTVPS